jgi:hypothetical protein
MLAPKVTIRGHEKLLVPDYFERKYAQALCDKRAFYEIERDLLDLMQISASANEVNPEHLLCISYLIQLRSTVAERFPDLLNSNKVG